MSTKWPNCDLNPGPLPPKPALFPAPGAQKTRLPWKSVVFCIHTDCSSFDGKVRRLPGVSISAHNSGCFSYCRGPAGFKAAQLSWISNEAALTSRWCGDQLLSALSWVHSQPLPTLFSSQHRDPHSRAAAGSSGPEMTDEQRKLGRGWMLSPAASNFISKGWRRNGSTSRQETFPLMETSSESG